MLLNNVLYNHQLLIENLKSDHLLKCNMIDGTVKPVLSGHLKIDKTKVLMKNGFVCLFDLILYIPSTIFLL